MELDVTFSQEPRIIEVEMSEAPDTFAAGIEVDNTVAVGNSDHRNLTFRDADDQHPISAITGLKKTLDHKVEEDEVQTLSNQDIEDLINSFV